MSATRVADVLLAVAAAPGPARITDLASELGLSKAVVHRVLQSLLTRGLVVASAGSTYALGPATAALGARALRESDLRSAALPALRELQARSGETATVSALVGQRRAYLDQIVSSKEVRMEVALGRTYPLHAGASGKAILAFAPDDVRRRILDGELARLTDATIVDPDRLRTELQRIVREGHAVSHGERPPGAASLAAPVFGFDGHAVGAISVCGPVTSFDPAACERLAPLVRRAAGDTSRRLTLQPGDDGTPS